MARLRSNLAGRDTTVGGQVVEPLTPQSVTRAIESGHGATALSVLQQLQRRADAGEGLYLAPPSHTWLSRLDDVTDDLVVLFLDLVRHYPRFDPPLTPEQIREESLEANLRYGSRRSSFHHALLVSTSPIPDFEADEVLLLLRLRGISGEQEIHAAQWLMSYLLDDLNTRRAAIRALRWMTDWEELDLIFQYVRPQLTAEEIEEII